MQSNWSQQEPGYPVASLRTRLCRPMGHGRILHSLFGLHVHLRMKKTAVKSVLQVTYSEMVK